MAKKRSPTKITPTKNDNDEHKPTRSYPKVINPYKKVPPREKECSAMLIVMGKEAPEENEERSALKNPQEDKEEEEQKKMPPKDKENPAPYKKADKFKEEPAPLSLIRSQNKLYFSYDPRGYIQDRTSPRYVLQVL